MKLNTYELVRGLFSCPRSCRKCVRCGGCEGRTGHDGAIQRKTGAKRSVMVDHAATSPNMPKNPTQSSEISQWSGRRIQRDEPPQVARGPLSLSRGLSVRPCSVSLFWPGILFLPATHVAHCDPSTIYCCIRNRCTMNTGLREYRTGIDNDR